SPSVTMMHVGKDFALRSAEWRQQTDPALVAKYSVKEGEVEAKAAKGDQEEKTQTLSIPKDAVFAAPCYAVDFVTIGAAGLKVGETKTFNSVGFGFPDWRLQVTKMTLERKEDTTMERPGGKSVAARHYGMTLNIPNMAAFTGEIWMDEKGVPLKST